MTAAWYNYLLPWQSAVGFKNTLSIFISVVNCAFPPLHLMERACNAENKWKSFCWRGRARTEPNSLKSSLTRTSPACCPDVWLQWARECGKRGLHGGFPCGSPPCCCRLGSTSDREHEKHRTPCVHAQLESFVPFQDEITVCAWWPGVWGCSSSEKVAGLSLNPSCAEMVPNGAQLLALFPFASLLSCAPPACQSSWKKIVEITRQ